jgi:hypothetical protein
MDIEDLPPEIKSEVDAVIIQTSSEELYILQGSIDATPPAVSAAVGLDSCMWSLPTSVTMAQTTT